MKEVEKKFFRYCMKHLEHNETEPYDPHIGIRFRDGYLMWDCMNDFSNKYNVPFKVIRAMVDKWDSRGMFEWCGDMWGRFYPENFPMEYAILVPPRTIRKCRFLVLGEYDYEWVFPYNIVEKIRHNTFKTVRAYDDRERTITEK